MPSHTAIKRPRPPTARRNHHSAGTAALRRTPRIPTAHRAPTSAGESAVPIPSHFHRKTRNATPTTPRQTPGNPITQRIAPPTSAGELPQPSAPRLRQAPECRGIPSGRHGHFFKQKILPVLWLKGFCIVYLYPLGNCRSSPRTATLGSFSICALQLSGFLPSCA